MPINYYILRHTVDGLKWLYSRIWGVDLLSVLGHCCWHCWMVRDNRKFHTIFPDLPPIWFLLHLFDRICMPSRNFHAIQFLMGQNTFCFYLVPMGSYPTWELFVLPSDRKELELNQRYVPQHNTDKTYVHQHMLHTPSSQSEFWIYWWSFRVFL